MKKMKKRRELDALVNGKLGRRKKGQHELLRNESESSEVEEFSIPEKAVMRNSSACRFCATCTTVCGFFLLTICIAAIGGLVWVHIEMKKEVDQLRSQLGQVQSKPNPEFKQLSVNHQNLEQRFSAFETEVKTNMSRLVHQVSVLETNLTKLSKQTVAPTPKTVESGQLAESIAQLGSKVQTVNDEVNKYKQRMEKLEGNLEHLTEDVDHLNSSMLSHYQQHNMMLNRLDNRTNSLYLQFSLMNAKPDDVDSPPLPNIDSMVQSAIHGVISEVVGNLTASVNAENIEMFHSLRQDVNNFNVSLQKLQQTQQSLNQEVQTLSNPSAENTTIPSVTEFQSSFQEFKNKTADAFLNLSENITTLAARVSNMENDLHANPAPSTNFPTTRKLTPEPSPAPDSINKDEEEEPASTTTESPYYYDYYSEEDDDTTVGPDFIREHLFGVESNQELKVKFQQWDTNSDGQLSYEELDDAGLQASDILEAFHSQGLISLVDIQSVLGLPPTDVPKTSSIKPKTKRSHLNRRNKRVNFLS